MKLAASNIAWDPSEDDAVAVVLRERGFTGVEIAPGKRWESPMDATKKEIAAYRAAWETRGLTVVAMQALLFGRPDLQLFGSTTVRRTLHEYLASLIEMAHGLGANALVFGSPKNRKRGALPLDEASDVAVEFFQGLGTLASSLGCVICIEPNPPSYDCDFINTTAEAVTLCEKIGNRGVRVNGDAGAMASTSEDPLTTIMSSVSWFGHFHASEPELAEVGDGPVQNAAADALKTAGWTGWISVEMRASEMDRVAAIARAAGRVRRIYTR
jgi:D-psicose/D-tagatose/L-ribulose 3-epimerase